MKYEVRVLRRAERDLEEIQRYIAQDSPFPSDQVASTTIDRLLDRIESLERLPRRGARPRDERLRRNDYRFVMEPPYLIFYKIRKSQVWVYRILHGKRAYERIL